MEFKLLKWQKKVDLQPGEVRVLIYGRQAFGRKEVVGIETSLLPENYNDMGAEGFARACGEYVAAGVLELVREKGEECQKS